MIVFFFTNLIHKFFILMHLLHSSTCFEHYYAHLQEDNCISTASGIVSLFRWGKVKRVTTPDAVLTQFVHQVGKKRLSLYKDARSTKYHISEEGQGWICKGTYNRICYVQLEGAKLAFMLKWRFDLYFLSRNTNPVLYDWQQQYSIQHLPGPFFHESN